MCGIAGLIVRNHKTQALAANIERMTHDISHRGPDDAGTWVHESVALGHRRLSIIDTSDRGAQPMINSKSGCVIVYNGEIYNYIEIRESLIAVGYQFVSNSDTEVILHAYDHWGTDCVERFNGMWAFAIYDPTNKHVFCSRDRFGIKPFYFTSDQETFAFGSEIRQLLPQSTNRTANAAVLYEFLVSRVAEPLDQTFFSGVHKLPGGYNLIYDLTSHQFSIDRYYELKQRPELTELSIDESNKQFEERLTTSIKIRLRSDVKVGTCLSGGLDSSSIAAIAASQYALETDEPFAAITAISEDPATDESHFAKQVVDHSKLHWIRSKPNYQDFTECIDAVAIAQEEPFTSASVVMQHAVMKAAQDAGIPVLLDGQGGDEMLLGYERYFANHIVHQAKSLNFSGVVDTYSGMVKNGRKGITKSLLTNLGYYHAGPLRQVQKGRMAKMLNAKFLALQTASPIAAQQPDMFSTQHNEIMETSMPAMLRYEDKNSMWHSIETRLPFLDHELAELCVSAKVNRKLSDGWTKMMLRKAVDDKLPASIVWRKNKFGFEAPEAKWLRAHAESIRAEIQSSPLLAEVCDSQFLQNAGYDKLHQGLKWRLYSVALWARQFNVTGAR